MKNMPTWKNWIPAFAGTVVIALNALTTGCAPRDKVYGAVGKEAPILRDFPADFQVPISHETEQPIGGFGGDGGGLTRTPVIFVHGNTVSANFWLPSRAYFKSQGWHGDELWALSYGWNSVRAFDSADLSVPTLERFVSAVQGYLSQKSGRSIRQVDIVAHSLGVTLVRQWLMQNNAWHRVRNFVAACGANHGVWTARPDARGQNRVVAFELFPGSPWLKQLNRFGETPGAVRYMTLYDGTGKGDVLFPPPYEHSPALEGAYNLAYNVKYGQHYDHLELPRSKETMQDIVAFLQKAREPLPEATPPEIIVTGENLLRTSQADSRVHCEAGGKYPTLKSPAALDQPLALGALYTCFAHSTTSGLSSPMTRFRLPRPDAQPGAALTLSARPDGGAYEQPQQVTLTTNDPEAYIVYTTSNLPPNPGSPLYREPIYLAGPVTLQAQAIAPDGRMSPMLRLEYDISLEKVQAQRALQRQFDPSTKADFEHDRKKGN
jgi:triacylglycerol esterase/lipase EstA (alpha/beta hydrolase family)